MDLPYITHNVQCCIQLFWLAADFQRSVDVETVASQTSFQLHGGQTNEISEVHDKRKLFLKYYTYGILPLCVISASAARSKPPESSAGRKNYGTVEAVDLDLSIVFEVQVAQLLRYFDLGSES